MLKTNKQTKIEGVAAPRQLLGSLHLTFQPLQIHACQSLLGTLGWYIQSCGYCGLMAGELYCLTLSWHPMSLHFMVCHSKKCHRSRTSSCHKVQRDGTEYGSLSHATIIMAKHMAYHEMNEFALTVCLMSVQVRAGPQAPSQLPCQSGALTQN